ncbi:collagen alpha-1(IX) chain-like isoform X2 [Amblyraja radiata]|uniref:collagen alpha-1(IX) chain-like isoform X2 n=1 Tax=Amblyraja radiata TaxID=386614 RepID=UPI00140347EB|nr:collagen alpha-1(IX) chain-like isoform X2 [Amblyraja radiata]
MKVLYSSILLIILLISRCKGMTLIKGHGESLTDEDSADHSEVLFPTSGNLSLLLGDSEIVLQSVSRATGITVTTNEIVTIPTTQPSLSSTESQISLQPASTDSMDTRFDEEMLSLATPTASPTTHLTGKNLHAHLTVSSPTPIKSEMPKWHSSTVKSSTRADGGIFSKSTSTNLSMATQSEVLSASTPTEPPTFTHSEVLSQSTSAENGTSTNTPNSLGAAVGPLPNVSLPTTIPSAYFEFAITPGSSDRISHENASERYLLTQDQRAASVQETTSVSQQSNALELRESKIRSTEATPENVVNTPPSVLITAATWSLTTSWQNEESLSKPLEEPPIQEIVKSAGIDLLKEFQVSSSGDVTEVEGSHPLSSAFRVTPSVYLRKETGAVYPGGIPPEYSIIATFKMLGDTAQNVWNLWEVSDIDGREQIGIRLSGISRSLDFFYRTTPNTVMFQTFADVDMLFDGSWHKLALSVSGKEINLLIDCKQVNTVLISKQETIDGNSYTSIARCLLNDAMVSLDLQQLELHSDPSRVHFEGCCELSHVCGRRAENSFTENLPFCKCSYGQLEYLGSTGTQEEKGEKGTAGESGRPGTQAARGNTGSYGRVGVTGPRGMAGIKGNKGVQGRPGQRGLDGPKGYKGLQGAMGFKGISGSPGPRGKIDLKGEKGDKGLPGSEGRPGVEGPRGLRGDPGFPGLKGTKGELGVPGVYGPKGDSGYKGILGNPGQPGRDGDPGIEAYQGQQGPKGQKGIIGSKGEKGLPGPRGHEGHIGKHGPKGHKGNAGIPGWHGIVGYPGNQGHVGYPGASGLKGDKGADGILGSEGLKGGKGGKGPKGEPGGGGDSGLVGLKGKRGPPGKPGCRGSLGERGIAGETGFPGFSGPAGPPGPVLPASHVIEVCKRLVLEQMSLYTSMVRRKCINACPLYGDVSTGPPGPVGEKGQPGKSGRPGINGRDGEQGPEGFTGELGDPGLQGLKGEHGVLGDKGSQGIGHPGFIGAQGSRGDHGKPGSSIPGQSGQQGQRGHTGQQGLPGYPGRLGTPGVCRPTVCN